MVLKDWLVRNELSFAAFAAEIGVSRVAVGRWVRGIRVPHPRLALRIEEYTRGHVPVSVWAETDHLPKGSAALVRWMHGRGMTGVATARAIGVTHASIYQWARGNVVPSAASLAALNGYTGLALTEGDFR